jgi:hypothetical protein
MKTIKAVVQELSRREGLKKQVDIAQISELVGHLSDMSVENAEPQADGSIMCDLFEALIKNGVRRKKKKAKAKA